MHPPRFSVLYETGNKAVSMDNIDSLGSGVVIVIILALGKILSLQTVTVATYTSDITDYCSSYGAPGSRWSGS